MQFHSTRQSPGLFVSDEPGATFRSTGALSGPQAPASAARLAAESEFQPSRQHSPEHPPTITVRRSRVPLSKAAEDEAGEQPAAESLPGGPKGPRIFRVVSAGETRADKPARSDSQPPAAGSSVSAAPAAAVTTRRRRRVGADQRPGPLRLIVQAPIASSLDTLVAERFDLTREQLAELAGRLASVQIVLDDIQRARELELLDPAWAAHWSVLLQRADQLARQLADHRSQPV